MPKFSKRSKEKLAWADCRIQQLMKEAIKIVDFSVLSTHRTPAEQMELYKKGREKRNGKWVKVGLVVTYKDGYRKKSYHNYLPSPAIDIKPYPKMNNETWDELAKVIKETAKKLNIPIEWGFDLWGFDKYHFQIPKKNWDD